MSTFSTMTSEELRIAERAVALVEIRIREHLYACPYCDKGPEAYREAEKAVRGAFRDMYDSLRKMRHEIGKESS